MARGLEFGLQGGEVSGRYELKPLESEIVVRTPSGETRALLAIPGLHNVRNALAAAACAHAAGIPAAATTLSMRMQREPLTRIVLTFFRLEGI